MRQLYMRQLQLQSGEKAADRVESGADLVPGRLNGSDDRRLDPIPYGSSGALDPVEQVGSGTLHGFKRGRNFALDPVHDRADRSFDPVPDRGGGSFDGVENRGDNCFHSIDLRSDGRDNAAPDAAEEGHNPVPYGLEKRFNARPHGLPCGAEPSKNDLCQRLQHRLSACFLSVSAWRRRRYGSDQAFLQSPSRSPQTSTD